MDEKKYQGVRGHPHLYKDPHSGAFVNLASSSNRDRKLAIKEKEQKTEERLANLENMVGKIYDLLKDSKND